MSRFKHPPVIHALAQVVFTQVLPLSEKIPNIQGRLIKAGYPYFENQQAINLAIRISGGAVAPENRVGTSRFQFLHRNRTSVMWLTSNSIVFAISAYEDYEHFADVFRMLLDAVMDGSEGVTEGALIQRVGLRFTDRIVPASGDQISDYVAPGLLGFSFSNVSVRSEPPSMIQTVSAKRTEIGQLVVRSFTLQDTQIMPPDISDSPLIFRVRTPDGHLAPPKTLAGRPGITLDFDHFTELSSETQDFELTSENVLKLLSSLHDVLSEAFRSATTDHARERWEAIPDTQMTSNPRNVDVHESVEAHSVRGAIS